MLPRINAAFKLDYTNNDDDDDDDNDNITMTQYQENIQ
jgi:hypothetical protein